MSRAVAAAVLLLGLGACAAPPPGARTVPPDRALILAPEGLDVGDTGLEVGFGRTEASTIASVSRLLGAGPTSSGPVPGCPGTAAQWDRAGLTLCFTDADFTGWRAAPAPSGLTTASGIGAGGKAGPLPAGIGSGIAADGSVAFLCAGTACAG